MKLRALESETTQDVSTAMAMGSGLLIGFGRFQVLGIALGVLALLALGGARLLKHRERRSAKKNAQAIAELISLDRVLHASGRALGFGGSDSVWRISLYALETDATEHVWNLKGRGASSPLMASYEDLRVLKTSEGVLRSCLPRGVDPLGAFDETALLPDPESELNDWVLAMEAWGHSPKDAKELSYKARVFAGVVFQAGSHSATQAPKTIGLVVESSSTSTTLRGMLESTLSPAFFEAVADLLHADSLARTITTGP